FGPLPSQPVNQPTCGVKKLSSKKVSSGFPVSICDHVPTGAFDPQLITMPITRQNKVTAKNLFMKPLQINHKTERIFMSFVSLWFSQTIFFSRNCARSCCE